MSDEKERQCKTRVSNCFVAGRDENEWLFLQTTLAQLEGDPDAIIYLPNLDGYMILPVETFEQLLEAAMESPLFPDAFEVPAARFMAWREQMVEQAKSEKKKEAADADE